MMREDEHGETEEPRRPRVVDKRVAGRQEPPVAHEPPQQPEPGGTATGSADHPPESTEGGSERLWTPAQEEARAQEAQPPRAEQTLTPEQEAQARQIAAEIARTPGREWVLQTAVNLANVAGLKLQERQLEDARLLIDALSGLTNEVGSRLEDAEAPLRQTVAQLQFAYAEATRTGPGSVQP